MKQNNKSNIPIVRNDEPRIIDLIANELEKYFISDKSDLCEALTLFSFENLAALLSEIEDFFTQRFDFNKISSEQIENLNFKTLSYEFANKIRLERPLITEQFNKEKIISIYSKLARLLLHEVLFPELFKIDPRLAASVKSQIKRSAGAIAVIEGIDPHYVHRLIRIDDVTTTIQSSIQFRHEETKLTENDKNIKSSKFLKTCLSSFDIDRLGRILKTDYKIILSIEEFRNLLSSDGYAKGSLRINSEMLKSFVWLIDQMYHASRNGRGLIYLNRTKGYWQYLQGVVINENEKWFKKEFKRIYSIMKNSTSKEDNVIKENINEILSPFKKIYL